MPHWPTKCVDAKALVLRGNFQASNLSGPPVPAIRHLMPIFHRIEEQNWNIGDGDAICG
jgi:hypothetical protein